VEPHGDDDMSSMASLNLTNGEITWIRRDRLKIRCNMDYSSFPFDKQLCFYEIGSTTDTDETIVSKNR